MSNVIRKRVIAAVDNKIKQAESEYQQGIKTLEEKFKNEKIALEENIASELLKKII